MKIQSINNPQNAADVVFNVVVQACEFYKDQHGELYLVNRVGADYVLKYLSRASDTKQFFRRLFYNAKRTTIKAIDLVNAYDTVCAIAESGADVIPVFTRVANVDNQIFYDCVDSANNVVKISAGSYVVTNANSICDAFFQRDSSMKEQKLPVDGGYGVLNFVEDFLNVEKNQRLLLSVFIYSAFVPQISHPVLIVEGEKGAGKTSALRKILELVNPTGKEPFVMPRSVDNLVTALSNNYITIFDNVGRVMSEEISNTLCQAATGGTLVKRKLYSDNTEIAINIKRIVALNGINLEISQSDLLDRAILVRLERISDTRRCPESIMNEKFHKYLPSIMHDIFVTIAKAMEIFSTVNLEKYPRMADFCKTGYAIAEAIGEGNGQVFVQQYVQNIKIATESAIEENPLFDCLKYIVEHEGEWTGKMSELLLKLKAILPKIYIGKNIPETFPKSANALSRKINTQKHELATLGIDVQIGRNSDRFITLKNVSQKNVDIDEIDDIPD